MKKILTLMTALTAVSGSALANDYDWDLTGRVSHDTDANNVLGIGALEDLTANGTVTLTKDGVAFAEGENNYISLSVDAGDVLTITASGSANDNVVVKGGVVNATASLKDGKDLTVTFDAATSDVKIYATAGAKITKVAVESEAYRLSETYIAAAQQVLKEANDETSSYVTNYPKFFTAVRAEINKLGKQIEEQIAVRDESKKNNTVAADNAVLQQNLQTISTNIVTIKAQAAQALADYEALVSSNTHYTAAKDTNKKALTEKPRKNDYQGHENEYFVDVTSWNSGSNPIAKVVVAKTDWVKGQLVEKSTNALNDILADAKAELAKFEKDFVYPTADYETKFDVVKTNTLNILERAAYERDNLGKIKNLQGEISTMEKLINNDPFAKPARFDDWKNEVNELLDAINKDTKEKFTGAECATEFGAPYTTLNNELTNMKAAWVTKAQDKLNETREPIQKRLDEVAYEVSAMYENEPETQKIYEAEFAKQQVILNDVKKTTANGGWSLVTGYDAQYKKLTGVRGEIENIYNKTQDEQKLEIVRVNNQKQADIIARIDSVKGVYSAGALKIESYKTIKGVKGDDVVIAAINASLKALFDDAVPLDDLKTKVVEETAELNKNYGKLDANAYNQQIDAYRDAIDTELQNARNQVNDAVYAFLTTDTDDTDEALQTLPEAAAEIQGARQYVATVADVAAAADAELDIIETGKIKNGQIVKGGYYKTTDDYIEEHKTAGDIADQIDAVKEKLAPIQTEVEALVKKVAKYAEIDKKIDDTKIQWTLAKAGTSANPDATSILNAVNEDINVLRAKLQNDGLEAINKTYDADFAEIEKKLYSVTDYEAYKANENANAAAKNELANAKKALADAIAQVNKIEDEAVRSEYAAKLNTIKFTNIEKDIENSYANKESKANLDSQKAALKTITDNIATLVAEAEEKANGVPGDYNGDKKVDSKDASIVSGKIAAGELTTRDYTQFLIDLKNYKANH